MVPMKRVKIIKLDKTVYIDSASQVEYLEGRVNLNELSALIAETAEQEESKQVLESSGKIIVPRKRFVSNVNGQTPAKFEMVSLNRYGTEAI